MHYRFNRAFSVKIRKDLLGAEEKAYIVATMRAGKMRSAVGWAMTFKRLPTTIAKFAAEANIPLIP